MVLSMYTYGVDYASHWVFSSVSKGNSHKGSRIHDPGKRVSHEVQELEKFDFLQHQIQSIN
jgi:hypothetical protein